MCTDVLSLFHPCGCTSGAGDEDLFPGSSGAEAACLLGGGGSASSEDAAGLLTLADSRLK